MQPEPWWTRARWVVGIAVNLVLALGYLVVVPLDTTSYADQVIGVTTCLVLFLLADGVTTNALGVAATRGRAQGRGRTTSATLVEHNLTVLTVVGLPILLLTAAMTLVTETPDRLWITLPAVGLAMAFCLAVGNVISVLLPVAVTGPLTMWRARRDRARVLRWAAAAGLPWLVSLVAEQVCDGVAVVLQRTGLLDSSSLVQAGAVLTALAVVLMMTGTTAALALARRRTPWWSPSSYRVVRTLAAHRPAPDRADALVAFSSQRR